MFKIFGGKPKSQLGIDIGSFSIKAVEILHEKERFKLYTYGILEDYTGSFSKTTKELNISPPLLTESELADAVGRILKQGGFASREAVVSIPVYSSFEVTLTLPKMSFEDLKSAVISEVPSYIPVPIDEVDLDWTLLAETKENTNLEVFLVAVPKEVTNRYLRIIELAGLKAGAMEIENFSSLRAFGNSFDSSFKDPIIVVDIGLRNTSITAAKEGSIYISHNFDFAGGSITKDIAENDNIDLQAAELKKRNNANKVQTQNIGLIKNLQDEISKVRQNFLNQYGQEAKKIIFCGGGSKFSMVLDNLKSVFDIEIELGNPFFDVSYPKELKSAVEELSPSLAVAVGLAKRKID